MAPSFREAFVKILLRALRLCLLLRSRRSWEVLSPTTLNGFTGPGLVPDLYGLELLFGYLSPSLEGPVPDPAFEDRQVFLSLLLCVTEILVHVARFSIPSVLAVIEPSHDGARVRPSNEKYQVGVAIHPGALVFSRVPFHLTFELGILGRGRAVAGQTFCVEDGFDVRLIANLMCVGA